MKYLKPKDKAKALCRDFSSSNVIDPESIALALKCVNELIRVTLYDPYDRPKTPCDKEYWLKVKSFIYKLVK